MISLYSLGSGSSGNAFLLDGPDGVVLLDAGFSAKELFKRAESVGVDLGRLVAIVVTHEHGDHSTGVRRLVRRTGAPVVATEGTLRALRIPTGAATVPIRASSVAEVGPCSIESCRTLHDAAEPSALVLEYGAARIGFAYDFGRPTAGLRHLLRGCDAIVLESNYDEVMLRTSDYPASVQHRIAGSGGHLSNRGAAELLRELWHPALRTVVLAHLSRNCNTAALARATVEPVLQRRGFRGRLAVATQHEPLGPLAVRAGGAKAILAAQVELDLFQPIRSVS